MTTALKHLTEPPHPLLPHFGFSLTETYSHAATVVLVINRR